ncbi:MAG: protein-L-isoaspartate(D-aspartate) O-methyltransferase [Candidatus ainarchaeum sp.]|nr:protein-L-isoaspartate(D-aspartate) O-methyltransferase [Candidatus ainarchaeum sp.]
MRENNFSEKRKSLVQGMVSEGALKSREIERAFLSVKREIFFPESLGKFAYEDNAFPIGRGQTISQPSTIAVMLEMLDLHRGMKVLEIGAGSAYVLALLSKIVGLEGKVFGIEILPELKALAEKNLKSAKCGNIELLLGNGCEGWPEKSPFDRILISAACSEIPKALESQLRENGKIVVPLGEKFSQEIVLMQKQKGFLEEKERKCCFVFVPLQC